MIERLLQLTYRKRLFNKATLSIKVFVMAMIFNQESFNVDTIFVHMASMINGNVKRDKKELLNDQRVFGNVEWWFIIATKITKKVELR